MGNMGLDALKYNLNNPQRVYMWEFEIPAPRGTGSSDVWLLRAQEVVDPGKSFEQISIAYKGTGGMTVPGREKYPQQFPAVFIEGEDKKVFDAIHSWMELIRGTTTGIGVTDLLLKTDALLRELSTTGDVTKTTKIVGLWPMDKQEVPLTYKRSGEKEYRIIFSYDRWEPVD